MADTGDRRAGEYINRILLGDAVGVDRLVTAGESLEVPADGKSGADARVALGTLSLAGLADGRTGVEVQVELEARATLASRATELLNNGPE